MMRRMLAMANKEFLQVIRDPLLLLWAFGLPIAMLLLFGYAITLDINKIPLLLVDPSPGRESREIAEMLVSSGYFEIVERVAVPAPTEDRFVYDKARIALVFSPDFGKQMVRGGRVTLQALVDAADNNTALIALGYLQTMITNHNQKIRIERLEARGRGHESTPGIEVRSRVWYNPELRSRNFIIPGLMASILGMMTVILTALCLAREYERGTMEQLLVSPLGRFELVIGKLVPYYVIGCIEVAMVLAFGRFFFDVPIKGTVFAVVAASMLFLFAGLGQGLLISIATKSQQVATQVGLISSMLPSLLLSGFMFPVSSMPVVIRWISAIVPARHLLDMLRAIMLKGAPLALLWPQMLFLAAVALLFFVLSFRALSRRLG